MTERLLKSREETGGGANAGSRLRHPVKMLRAIGCWLDQSCNRRAANWAVVAGFNGYLKESWNSPLTDPRLK